MYQNLHLMLFGKNIKDCCISICASSETCRGDCDVPRVA